MKKLLLLLSLVPLAVAQQQYIVSTVTGIGLLRFGGSGAPAVNAFLITPQYVATDSAGNVFVSNEYYNQVFKSCAAGNLFIVDNGNGRVRKVTPDGTVAMAQGGCIALDAAGDLFVTQSFANVIHMLSPSGVISTTASTGQPGYNGDGIKATAAASKWQGMISTIAGNAKNGHSGDNIPAQSASIQGPEDVAIRASSQPGVTISVSAGQ